MNSNPLLSEQSEWRGLPLYDAFGRKSHLTSRQVFSLLRHPFFIMFVAIITILLVSMDVHGYRLFMTFTANWFVWAISVTAFVSIYSLLLLACISISRRFSQFFMIMPVFGMVSISLSTYLTIYFIGPFFGMPFLPENYWFHIFENIVIAFLFETIFDFFVRGMIMSVGTSSSAESQVSPNVTEQKTVTISGRQFFENEILVLRANDHYIEVRTDSETVLLRARMVDCVSQITSEIGVFPHRSHWVARRFISGLESGAYGKVLRLTDGTELPVARGRVADVKKWLG